MKKVAITTITKVANYGNILQNLALQKVIRRLGFQPETIINLSDSDMFCSDPGSLKRKIKWLVNHKGFRAMERRNRRFRECCDRHITYSPVTYENGSFSGPLDYDFYVTGSDQVWNPTFGMATDFEFLRFAPRSKKLSYAASFGISSLDSLSEGRRKEIIEQISSFPDISVREEAGKRIVEGCSSVPAHVHPDPTMLLSAKEWYKYCEKPQFSPRKRYILLYMLGEITEEYQAEIELLEKKYHAVSVNALKGKYRYMTPLEFLWMIRHAECICTDSFHASVFSILFHRQFYIFTRKDHHADQSSRFETLLKLCGIDPDQVTSYNDKVIDWKSTDKCISKNRKDAIRYLKSHLENPALDNRAIEILNKESCCGCSSCSQICPKGCIEMNPDREGFLYPSVDYSLCVNCGLCRSVCPVILADLPTSPETASEKTAAAVHAYAAYVRDEAVRLGSSSGGIFTPLAEQILRQGGIVFGAALDKKQHVRHIAIDSAEDMDLLRGSKYVQSETGNSFKEAKKYLEEGKTVLFSGTACQIHGLKAFLRKDYTNLYTVDVLCHGTPSPKLWERYLADQEKCHHSAVRKSLFRDKKYGWKNYSMKLLFDDSTEYLCRFPENSFMRLFLGNICLRPSCHRCGFKSINRDSDLTLGDAWGIDSVMPEMDDDKGTSVILVHSEKGQRLLDSIESQLVIKAGEVDLLLPPTADSRKSVGRHPARSLFFRQLEEGKSCDELTGLLALSLPFKSRLKRKVLSTAKSFIPVKEN